MRKNRKRRFIKRVICMTLAFTLFLSSGPVDIAKAFVDSGLAKYFDGCIERLVEYINAHTAHAGNSTPSYSPVSGSSTNTNTNNTGVDVTALIDQIKETVETTISDKDLASMSSLEDIRDAIASSNQSVIDSNKAVADAQNAVASAQQAVAAAEQALATANTQVAEATKLVAGAIDFLTDAVGHNTEALNGLLKYIKGEDDDGIGLIEYLKYFHKFNAALSDNILGYTKYNPSSGEYESVVPDPNNQAKWEKVYITASHTRTVSYDFRTLNEILFENFGYYVKDENGNTAQVGSIAEDFDTVIKQLSHEYRVADVYSYNAQLSNVLWKPFTSDVPYIKEICETSNGGFASTYFGHWDAYNYKQTVYPHSGNNRYYQILGDDALVRYDSLSIEYQPDQAPKSEYYSEVAGIQDRATWSDAIRLIYRALGKNVITTTLVSVPDDSITPENFPGISGLSNPGDLDGYNLYVFSSRSNYAMVDRTDPSKINYTDYYLAKALTDGCLPKSLTVDTAKEPITARDLWLIAARLMHIYGEPIMSKAEVKQLLQVYGSQYPVEFGEAYANAWAFLKARGCLDMSVSPTDEVTLEYVLDMCMRIKDKDSRLDYKTVNIVVSLDEAVIDTGFYPIDNLGLSGDRGTAITYNYGNTEYIDTFIQDFDYVGGNYGHIGVWGVTSSNNLEFLLLNDQTTEGFAWETYSGVDKDELTDCFVIKVNLIDADKYQENPDDPAQPWRLDDKIANYQYFIVGEYTTSSKPDKIICKIPQESLGGIVRFDGEGNDVRDHMNFEDQLYAYTDQVRHPIAWKVASSTASVLASVGLFFSYVFNPVKAKALTTSDGTILGGYSCSFEYDSFDSFSKLFAIMIADSTKCGWESTPDETYVAGQGDYEGKTFNRVNLYTPAFLDIPQTNPVKTTYTQVLSNQMQYVGWNTRNVWNTSNRIVNTPNNISSSKPDVRSDLEFRVTSVTGKNLTESRRATADLLRLLRESINPRLQTSIPDVWRGILNGSTISNTTFKEWYTVFGLNDFDTYMASCDVIALASYLKGKKLWLQIDDTSNRLLSFDSSTFGGNDTQLNSYLWHKANEGNINLRISMPFKFEERIAWSQVSDLRCSVIDCANGLKGVKATFYFMTSDKMQNFLATMEKPEYMGTVATDVPDDVDPVQQISNKLLQDDQYAPALANLSGDMYVSWSLLKDYTDIPGDPDLSNDMLSFWVKGHGQINIDKKNNTCLVNTILLKMDPNTPLFLLDTSVDPSKPELYIHYKCLVGIDPEKVIVSIDPNGNVSAAAQQTITLTDGTQRTLKIGTNILNTTTVKSSANSVTYADLENVTQGSAVYTEITGIRSYLGQTYPNGRLLQMMSTFPTANWVVASPNSSTLGSVYVYYPVDLFADSNEDYQVDEDFIGYWAGQGKSDMSSMESAQFVYKNQVTTVKQHLLTELFGGRDFSELTKLELVTYYNLILMYNDYKTITFSKKYFIRSFSIMSEDTFLQNESDPSTNEGKMFFSQYIGYFYVTPENFDIDEYRRGNCWLPLKRDGTGKITSYNINSWGLVTDTDGVTFKVPYGYILTAVKDSDQYRLVNALGTSVGVNSTSGLTWNDSFGEEGNAIAAPAGIANLIINQGIYSTVYIGNLSSSAMRQVAFYVGSRRLYYNDSDTGNGIPFTFLEGSKTYVAIDSNTGLIHVTNDSRGKHHYVFIPTLSTVSGAYQDVALSEYEIATVNPIYSKISNYLMNLDDITNIALYILFYIIPYIMYVWIIILVVMALMPAGVTKAITQLAGIDLVYLLTFKRRTSDDWRGWRVIVGLVVAFIAMGLFYGPNLLKIIEIVTDWAYSLSGMK